MWPAGFPKVRKEANMARKEEVRRRDEVQEISVDYCLSNVLSGFFSFLELVVI